MKVIGKDNSTYIRFLSEVSDEKKAEYQRYFEDAPPWVLESAVLERLPKDAIILREEEPVDTVFFVLKGVIKAVDYRVSGVSFDFAQFDKFYAMGGMEIIMDLDRYMTTLKTVTRCSILRIRSDIFKRWLDSDPKATKHEAQMICEYLLEEGRMHRVNLFLTGKERMMFLYLKRYEKYNEGGVYIDLSTRQELADAIAVSLKTSCRAIEEMEREGFLCRKGHKIIIKKDNYDSIKSKLESSIFM